VLTRFILGYLMTQQDVIVNDTSACTPVTSQISFLFSWGGLRLSPLGMSATNWATVPAQDDGEFAGDVGSTRRKPAPLPFCPP
jgi:hypothetical protein